MNAYKKQDHKNVAINIKASQAEKGNQHKEYNCQRCPRNIMTRGIKQCQLYKDYKDYENVKARMKKEAEFNKYMKNSPEVFSRLFKGWARATQIFKYEIGIFKELRQEKKGDEIKLVGVCDSNWNAEASLKEYQADAVKYGVIKEELDKREREGIILISHDKKDKEVNYWKEKAYIIFQQGNINRLECPKHDTHIERSFDPWKVIEEKKCLTCESQAKIFRGECRVNK